MNKCSAVGHIYVVTSKFLLSKNLFKIGYIKNIKRRLENLNCYQALKMLELYRHKVFLDIDCVRQLEQKIHQRFEEKKCTEMGKNEWFYLTSADIVELESMVINWLSTWKECVCHSALMNNEKNKVLKENQKIINNLTPVALDPENWLATSTINIKYTLSEICTRLGFEILNDLRNKLFWDNQLLQFLVVTEDVLDYLGYFGDFRTKNYSFRKLLHKHSNIKYGEVTDKQDSRKKYVVLSGIDFEAVLMQMRSSKAMELRQLYSIMKIIFTNYCRYELLYKAKFE